MMDASSNTQIGANENPEKQNHDKAGAQLRAPCHDPVIEVARIMRILPHRYPFLMIDRIVDHVSATSAVGIKNVTINEPQFQGHFPTQAVMPGVLIIEAMAQTAAVVVFLAMGAEDLGALVHFMSVESAKFRRPVFPGDQLKLHVEKQQRRGPVWRFRGVGKVDGVEVAEAVYTAMIRMP